MLSKLLDRMADYVLGHLNPVNEVNNILAGFTRMVERLDAAAEKIAADIATSYRREDQAWQAFRHIESTERVVRDNLRDAEDRARNARLAISKLTGETTDNLSF